MNGDSVVFGLLALSVVSCRDPVHFAPRPSAPTDAAEPVSAPPGMIVRLGHEPSEPRGVRVEVEVVHDQANLRVWSIESMPWLVDPTTLSITDAAGSVPWKTSTDGGVQKVELAREVRAPLRIAYVARPPGVHDSRLSVGRHEMFVTGEAVLLLPEGLDTILVPIELHIDPCGAARPRAASSFGPGTRIELVARGLELRHADYLCGEIDVFDLRRGTEVDWVLAAADVPYDARWSAAEIAVARTNVDAWFGASSQAPFTTILRVDVRPVYAPPIETRLRTRSMTYTAEPTIGWEAAARIETVSGLVRRWLAGRFPVERAASPLDLAPTWWTHGLSRFIAMEILVEIGLLRGEDYVAVLDDAELSIASAAALPMSGHESTHAAALGLLYGLRLDRRLAAGGLPSVSLADLMSRILSTAERENVRSLAVEHWLQALEIDVDVRERESFETMLRERTRPHLPRDVLEPCFRPRVKAVALYELGLMDPRRHGEPLGKVAALDPSGPAAAAGIRPGDVLVRLEYRPEFPEQPVVVEVDRNGAHMQIEFQPRLRKTSAVHWLRSPKATRERCGD